MRQMLFTIKFYGEIDKDVEKLLKIFLDVDEASEVLVKREGYLLTGGILNEEQFNILLAKLAEYKRLGKIEKCFILPADTEHIPVTSETIQVIDL